MSGADILPCGCLKTSVMHAACHCMWALHFEAAVPKSCCAVDHVLLQWGLWL